MLKKKLFLKSIRKKNAYPEHPRNPENLLLKNLQKASKRSSNDYVQETVKKKTVYP